ncbi:MAG: SPFH/Band 7/PHB domain protein [Actinomycetota bacterium]|jgi:regulator of protease activity HflC (stomatin/prohibitin superfamily)|nr:SPFH/Band 7/PHB domain protein [Actinomycetota bacterium]
MMIASTSGGTAAGIIVLVLVVLMVILLARSVRVIQQGFNGVVKRFGQFHSVKSPGIAFLVPFADQMARVDVREVPRTGDRQDVITKDNVGVMVSATIFSQVIDPKSALFAVSNFELAIFQLAQTALRAVFGGLTLDEALSERERINTELQQHMDPITEKWGVRCNRIEVVDIVPPTSVLQAMSLQKEAEQHKRAAILTSEGQKQAAINAAEGQKQAAILAAEGEKQARVRLAEGEKEATILRAQGKQEALARRAQGKADAITSVYSAILERNLTPELLAVLQLETLTQVAKSDNAKLVVPYEAVGLLGATQALKDALSSPARDDSSSD